MPSNKRSIANAAKGVKYIIPLEIPVARVSQVIDGRAVFTEFGAHSVDTEWHVFSDPAPMTSAIQPAEESAENAVRRGVDDIGPVTPSKGRQTMKLFTVGKVGCFCEAAGLSTETRRGEVVKIAVVTLRVEPFDHKLASAMGCDGVRPTLFKLNHPDPNPILGTHIDLAVGVPRQILKVFEAPDVAKGSIAFDQARIYGVHALAQKDAKGFALRFKASFGPLSARELEFINGWRLSQKFVTFDEAEPGMFDEAPDGDDGDEEEAAAAGHTPMFDTEPDGKPLEETPERAYRRPHSHATKKKAGPRKAAKKGRR